MFLFELLHIGDQALHALDRHGVVDGGPHAAHRAMTFQLDHPPGRGAFQKIVVQFRILERERYVHARAILFRHRVAEEGTGIEKIVKQLRLLDVPLLDLGDAAELLQPLEYQPGDVDRVAGRRVAHRVGLGLELVVHDARRAFGGAPDQVLAHDHDRQAGRTDVLLRAGVDQAEFRYVDRPRQEMRGGVDDQGDVFYIDHFMKFDAADGLVRAVVEIGRVFSYGEFYCSVAPPWRNSTL